MHSTVGAWGNWELLGIAVFGAAYLLLLEINLRRRRFARAVAGSITGLILSVLDMFLMLVLWHIPLHLGALLIGFFAYSCWALVFKIEELDYNGRVIMLGLSAMVTTYMENIVIGGLGTGRGWHEFYPVEYWSYLATLIYFMVMLALGCVIYLLIYKRLSGDESVRVIML